MIFVLLICTQNKVGNLRIERAFLEWVFFLIQYHNFITSYSILRILGQIIPTNIFFISCSLIIIINVKRENELLDLLKTLMHVIIVHVKKIS